MLIIGWVILCTNAQ